MARGHQKLFGKSSGWKERFREQCLERVSDLRASAQQAQRRGISASEMRTAVNSGLSPNLALKERISHHTAMEEMDKEWIKDFVAEQLAQFDQYDDDDFIEHRLSAEDQVELYDDINSAYFGEDNYNGMYYL